MKPAMPVIRKVAITPDHHIESPGRVRPPRRWAASNGHNESNSLVFGIL